MSKKLIGGLLIAIGLGMIALGAVNYLGYGLGLDGNTPAIAVGAMLIFLGWLKFGDKTPKAGSDSPPADITPPAGDD